jgi:PKD repeat protein
MRGVCGGGGKGAPILLVTALVAAGAGSVAAAPARAVDHGHRHKDGVSGPQAVQIAGARRVGLATRYGWSQERVSRELVADPSLRMSSDASTLFYVDAAPVGAQASPAVQHGVVPSGDVFTLHSSPGANTRIYLDFDGQTITSTEWNELLEQPALTLAPFDMDGDPTTFSDGERQIIATVWSQVADDYDMFDVDVTTEAPALSDLVKTGSGDQRIGQRVVITNTNIYDPALGVALLDTFGAPVDTPAMVFNSIVGRLLGDPVSLAHGVSHEAGHTLGLTHDGRINPNESYFFGSPGWVPIMGGAGIGNYVTWSKGEYDRASNHQDDLAVLDEEGLTPWPDVVGNTPATSWPIAPGTELAIGGRIETAADVDVYRFGAGGAVSLAAGPAAPFEPNLDLRMRLRDSAGAVVAESDAPGRGAVAINVVVPDGIYFIELEGVGFGNPLGLDSYSDYASLGTYIVTGSIERPTPSGGMPPVAAAAYVPAGALTVAFAPVGSYDPEFQPLAFLWNFGDGSSSAETAPVHSFPRPGTYGVQLTVRDVEGLATTYAFNVAVADPAKVLHLNGSDRRRTGSRSVRVRVQVVDGYGRPVRGVAVRGRWSNSRSTSVAITNSKGVASFFRSTKSAVTFTTTKVSKTSRTWDGQNMAIAVGPSASRPK